MTDEILSINSLATLYGAFIILGTSASISYAWIYIMLSIYIFISR